MRLKNRPKRSVLCLIALFSAATPAYSQDETQVSGVQILGINAIGGEISGDASQKLAEGAVSMFSSGGGGSFSFGSPLGGIDPNSGSQLFNLLSNESVRKELKLTDEQYAGTQKIMRETGKRTSDYIRSMIAERKSEGPGIRLDGTALRELQAEASEQAEAAIEEILLPDQLTRIRQLAYQIEVAKSGLGEALVNGRLGSEIDVHDDQKQHITDRAAAIEAEARAAIAKIRTAARAKLLAELTPDQRKSAQELLGTYFEYEELSLTQQLQRQLKARQSQAEESGKD